MNEDEVLRAWEERRDAKARAESEYRKKVREADEQFRGVLAWTGVSNVRAAKVCGVSTETIRRLRSEGNGC